MRRLARHTIIISILAGCGAALAAGGDMVPLQPETPPDPVIQGARMKFEAKDWAGAQELLARSVAASPQNADYHNLYAYAIRKGPDPSMDLVFRHYNEALRLDPKHRGAHEYLGEAYLMQGNVAKAKEHLAQLDRLCFFGCEEYTMLKQAIAGYEQQQAKK